MARPGIVTSRSVESYNEEAIIIRKMRSKRIADAGKAKLRHSRRFGGWWLVGFDDLHRMEKWCARITKKAPSGARGRMRAR